MMQLQHVLQVKRLSGSAVLPTRAHDDDAGFDLYSDEKLTISPGQLVKISTNIALKPPTGYYGQIKDRSSVGSRHIKVYGGVIDESYTGDIIVCLVNTGLKEFDVLKGTRIAQIVFVEYGNFEVLEVDSLQETSRGDGGFGSTGV